MGSSSHQVLRNRVPTCLSGPYRHAFYAEGASAGDTLNRRFEFVEHSVRLLVAVLASLRPDAPEVERLAGQLKTPALGHWMRCADALSRRIGPDDPVGGAIAGILRGPDGRQTEAAQAVETLIQARNAMAHFREDASRDWLKQLRKPLRALLAGLEGFQHIRVFAVRDVDLISNPPKAEVHRLMGLEPMRVADIPWVQGLVKGQPWLLDAEGRAWPLAPWLLVDWSKVPTSLVLERWDKSGPHYWTEQLGKNHAAPEELSGRLGLEALVQRRGPVELGPSARSLQQAHDRGAPVVEGLSFERKLGTGASGEVWLASQTGQKVAVKLLKPELAEDPHQRERLRREHAALSRLSELGIPKALDLVQDEEHGPVLVMEYVEGERLDEACARKPMSPDRAQMLAEDLLKSLIAAHEAGIWHRDIKPQNIVMRHQVPVLLDFGIASIRDAAYLTRTFARMGTVAYAPPEQVHGGELGPWSDLFSVGRVLGFAVTGSSDPERHVAALPSGLLSIYTRATRERPADRFSSAEEMLRVLKAVTVQGAPIHPGVTLAGAWAIADELGRPAPDVWAFRAFHGADRREDAVVVAIGEGQQRLQQAIAALTADQRRALGSPNLMQSHGCLWCALEGESPIVAIKGLFSPRQAAPPPSPPSKPEPPPAKPAAGGISNEAIGIAAAGGAILAGLAGALAVANIEKKKKAARARRARLEAQKRSKKDKA